ncbi:helix-turn-helix domain-containing protein [Azotobacter salinestris]|uniref:helix-turn-helix domain-containing protein n=1 Tax=Azotobacter salinestris TaxID=69964 RepID=UPI0032DFD654
MTDKNKADRKASPKESPVHDTSTDAQRARLLARLQAGPVDTITARSELNIMMPAARVKELRDQGHPIKTHRITLTDEHGRTHHGVALYYFGMQADASNDARSQRGTITQGA